MKERLFAARCSLSGTIDPPELRENFVKRDSRYPQGFQVDGFGADLREKPAHIRGDNWRGISQGRGIHDLIEPEHVFAVLVDVLAVDPLPGRLALFEVQPGACFERHQVFRPDDGYAFNKSNAGLQKGVVLLIKEDR